MLLVQEERQDIGKTRSLRADSREQYGSVRNLSILKSAAGIQPGPSP